MKTQNCRLRSANRGNANNTWNVNTTGNVNNNNATNANRCAPDCINNARYSSIADEAAQRVTQGTVAHVEHDKTISP